MKTSAGNILTTGAGFAQRLFSRLKSTLCTSAEIAPELGHQSETSRAKPVTQLVAAVMLTLISTALLAPRTAEAWPELLDSIFFNYNTSAQAYQCGNCHTTWFSAGPGYSSLTDFVLFNPRYTSPTSILANNGMYVMDADNDGSSNLAEIKMSQSITRPPQFATGVSTGPNVANNWNWQLPDVDGDGCSTYFSRFTEEGMFGDTSAVAGASIVGTGTTTNNYKRFNPRGWDMDDNDASQGCSLAWTNTSIAVAPGTSGDFTPPGKVNTLSGAALASGAIPLKWVPVGDDGNGNPGDTTGGKAHSYDLRFTTTAFANGTSGRNPRSAADWRTMFDIRDTNPSYTGTWADGSVSLRQALYEPRPDAPSTPTTIQTCNAIGTTCTAGASYDIKARGVNVVVNPISNLTTYWIAMLVQDGVTRLGAGGTLTTPVSVTEQSTLSNIIAVTAGGSGAAISSISPTTLTGTAVVTVNGFGLANLSTNALGAAYQMVLTDVAGLARLAR